MKLLITEEMYDIAIPLIMDRDSTKLEHESFARGYHAYINIWSPLIGESK